MLLRRLHPSSILQCRFKANHEHQEMPLNIPTGESDIGLQSRLNFLGSDPSDTRIGIKGMSRVGFRMYDKSFLYGPIACFPTVALSWRVPTPDYITPESLDLFFMLRPKLDVVVLGVGSRRNLDAVRRRVAGTFHKRRIGLEIMVTEDAVTTFNFLNEERRYVAGAFYPEEDMTCSQDEYADSLVQHQSFDYLPGNPLFSPMENPFNDARGALYRMYGCEAKAAEMFEHVEKIRLMDKQKKDEYVTKMLEKLRAENQAKLEQRRKEMAELTGADKEKLPEK